MIIFRIHSLNLYILSPGAYNPENLPPITPNHKPPIMHLILTGATGLVGSGVLDAMIKMKDITKISIISRRPVKMAEDAKDPRINVIIHKDFNNYDKELLDKLRGASGVVWALGISQALVDKESVHPPPL